MVLIEVEMDGEERVAVMTDGGGDGADGGDDGVMTVVMTLLLWCPVRR